MKKSRKRNIFCGGGYSVDSDSVMKSPSGAIGTALAKSFMENGGYVAGAVYASDFSYAKYIVTNNIGDIERLRGSKYVEVRSNGIYKKVAELINDDKKVLFIGLPCNVAALYKFLGSRPENLWTCELVCNGPTKEKVHTDFIKQMEKKYKSKIVDFSVRHKKKNWLPVYLYIKFENGKEFTRPLYDTDYGYGFAVLGKESCYKCQFKDENRLGDMMIGDFWGAKESDEFWNEKGTSVIFIETNKGKSLIQSIAEIRVFPSSFDYAIRENPMVVRSKERHPDRDKFEKMLNERGLRYAVSHTDRIREIKKRLKYTFPL